MWTAKLKQVSRDPANPDFKLAVMIEIDDGVTEGSSRKRTIPYSSSNCTDDAIVRFCLNEIRGLVATDARYEELKAILGTPIDLTILDPKPQPEPTEEQIAQQTYAQKRQDLMQAKQDLELGLMTQEEFDLQVAATKDAKATLIAAKLPTEIIK